MICAAPDGSLWFTEQSPNRIGHISLAGVITEYPVPTESSGPWGIAAAQDGTIWFTEFGGKIGRLSPAGQFTEYPIPTPSSYPIGIALDTSGRVWFTETGQGRWNGQIGRLDPTTGEIVEFPLPFPAGARYAEPWDITAGPRGKMWFTEIGRNAIGSIDMAALPPTAGAVSIPTLPPLGLLVLTVCLAAVGWKVLGRTVP